MSSISRLALIAALLVGTMSPLCADPARPRSGEALSEWMNYAYFWKDPEPIADLLAWMAEEKVMEKKPSFTAAAAAFFSEKFKADPDRVAGWIAPAKTWDETLRTTVAYGLWIAERPDLAATVAPRPMPDFAARPPKLAEVRPTNPVEVDVQWAAFTAGGNPVHIRNIVDVLDDNRVLTGKRSTDQLVRAAATWSLTSNAAGHERVVRILRAEAEARPAEIRAKIDKILADARAGDRPFPTTDGEFSAMLVVADAGSLVEFDKPSSGGVNLRRVDKVGRDHKVFVKAVFAGQQLGDDLESDVTWDVTITDPAGKPWSGADLKNLEGMKGRTPLRFRVFDSRGFPTLWFTEEDVPGVYRIAAEIRDRIGNRRIELTETIEYVK